MREASDSWSDRWGLVACLLLALVVRGLAMFARTEELTHDRDAYLGIARGIAAGRGTCSPESFTPTAFRPPLYPSLLGVLMVALPAGVAVGLINAVAGVVTVWATLRAGQSLGLGRASLIAAALVAIDPMLLWYGTQPMTESICAGLVSLLILVVVSWPEVQKQEVQRENPRSRFGLVCASSSGDRFRVGVLFGLLVLCRPTFWPLVGVMGAVLVAGWVMRRAERAVSLPPTRSVSEGIARPRPRSRFGLVWEGQPFLFGWLRAMPSSIKWLPWRVIAGALLVVAPWVVRNQLVIGSPLLTTTHGGYTLLLANNSVFADEVVDQPWGTVWSGESLARWQAGLDVRLGRELGPNASELERDRRLSQWGREFIAAEPRRFARAVWHRVRSLWSVVPHGDTESGPSRLVIVAVGGFYSILLLAFVVGMFVVARRSEWSRWWLLYALVITVQGVHLVYWTNARMRAPLTPVIALFAVAAAQRRMARSPLTSRGL